MTYWMASTIQCIYSLSGDIYMITDSQRPTKKLVRIKKVVELTGLSKSYIYDLSNKGIFPKSIQLVPGGTSVAWVEGEILNWIDSRIQERNQVGTI
jgi:prophage regulatory protein